MAQRNRYVGPGTWHHVYNRGIDKRIILASRADYRLHELAGMRCEQVARAMGVSNGTISRWIRVHRRCMKERDRYVRTAAAVARLAVRRTHQRRSTAANIEKNSGARYPTLPGSVSSVLRGPEPSHPAQRGRTT